MAGFNFAQIGKVFVDTYHMNINTTGMFVGFQSGPSVHGFVIPLALGKKIQEALNAGIQEYEKKNGPIDTAGATSGILSNIQPSRS